MPKRTTGPRSPRTYFEQVPLTAVPATVGLGDAATSAVNNPPNVLVARTAEKTEPYATPVRPRRR